MRPFSRRSSAVAKDCGRYGYPLTGRRLPAKAVSGVRRRGATRHRSEGALNPHKQPKKERLWMSDGSFVRLRPEQPNHVWSYASIARLNSGDVVDALTDLFILRGPPEYIRSDNGPHTPCASLRDVIAEKVRDWIAAARAKTHAARPSLRDVNAAK